MGVHREISLLEPKLRKRVERALIEFERRGFPVLISETLRDLEVQQAYYAQGRATLAEVNALREKANLYILSPRENQNTVTNCDGIRHKSNHQARDESGFGHAIDLVPAKYDEKGNKNFWWNAPQEVWEKMGEIAEECGLDWCYGGKGESWGWDTPHFEILKDYDESLLYSEEKVEENGGN